MTLLMHVSHWTVCCRNPGYTESEYVFDLISREDDTQRWQMVSKLKEVAELDLLKVSLLDEENSQIITVRTNHDSMFEFSYCKKCD